MCIVECTRHDRHAFMQRLEETMQSLAAQIQSPPWE